MHDTFGDRMKRYEEVTNTKLMNLSPVILRLDGKAFHTLTKHLTKPFDIGFSEAMNATMWHLLRSIQNCVFGYSQSDEISLLLIEPTYISESWFDNRVQKIVSVAAAEASCFFRDYMRKSIDPDGSLGYAPFIAKAIFDARVFNIPRHEVINYFIWRQQDCLRNAILGAGQVNFSQKQINNLNCTQIIDKLKEAGLDFYTDYPQEFIWGKIAYQPPVEMQNIYTDCVMVAKDFKTERQTLEKLLPEY